MRRPLCLLALAIALASANALGQSNELTQRAHQVLSEALSVAPEWKDARIAEPAFPLFRPDIASVAYFEFPVTAGGNASPSGSIILATDDHDYPVVQWGTRGLPIVERLARTAKSLGKVPSRYYMLDALSFAVEDSRGQLITRSGADTDRSVTANWKAFKGEYARSRAGYHKRVREQSKNDWLYWTTPSNMKGSWCGEWIQHFAGTDADQRLYRQLDPGEMPNDSECASGCGATAWAMLFGWIDWRATMGDRNWPSGVWSNLVGADASNVAKMIWELRNDLRTSCVACAQGQVLPWNMGKAAQYLQRRVNPALWTLRTSWTLLSVPTDGKRDEADAVLRSGRPVIIQLGWEHYPLAYGYRKKDCKLGRDIHEFKINEGNNGDLRWTSASTSFVGHVARSDVATGPGTYWDVCRTPPEECDQGLVCYEGYCRRYPAEWEPCLAWSDKPRCATALICLGETCVRPPTAGNCTACVPGESNCNASGCPSTLECSAGENPICIGGSSSAGNSAGIGTSAR